MDQYTGAEIIDELKGIVKEWRVKSEMCWALLGNEDISQYKKGAMTQLQICAARLKELISKYDVN